VNEQTAEIFSAETGRVRAASPEIIWDKPSRRDADRKADVEEPFVVDPQSAGLEPVKGAGTLRGTILHKMMEEFLTGELLLSEGAVQDRARELLKQLASTQGVVDDLPEPEEMANTALETYRLPELAPFVRDLVPEFSLWSADPPHYVAGRADAASVTGEGVSLVVDWKSDTDHRLPDHPVHAAQLRDYLRVTGAKKGALVYMSLKTVVWVTPEDSSISAAGSPELWRG
jgi:hypothetical protein